MPQALIGVGFAVVAVTTSSSYIRVFTTHRTMNTMAPRCSISFTQVRFTFDGRRSLMWLRPSAVEGFLTTIGYIPIDTQDTDE